MDSILDYKLGIFNLFIIESYGRQRPVERHDKKQGVVFPQRRLYLPDLEFELRVFKEKFNVLEVGSDILIGDYLSV